MKTNNIFKSIFLIVAVLFSANLLAQPTLPDDYVSFQKAGEEVDTVTVGSKMAYRVDGDPVIQSLITAGVMNPSEFKWEFSTSLTMTKPNGSALTNGDDQTGYPNYYTDKEIYVIMPTTVGGITLTVNERSMPKNGIGCEGSDSTANILVINRPTMAWPGITEIGSCGVDDIEIDLTLTGYSDWVVTYDVYFTASINGTRTRIHQDETATVGSNKKITVAESLFNQVDGQSKPVAGTYEIVVTNLTDRISRKSIDQTLIASQAGDIPTDAFKVYVYPAPASKKLQHVKNMP